MRPPPSAVERVNQPAVIAIVSSSFSTPSLVAGKSTLYSTTSNETTSRVLPLEQSIRS